MRADCDLSSFRSRKNPYAARLKQRASKPPHPGEFIVEVYLKPNGISGRELAAKLDVAASTLSRVLNGTDRVTPEMALRLSKAIGRSPETWLTMQDIHDLWVARQQVNLKGVGKLRFAVAKPADAR